MEKEFCLNVLLGFVQEILGKGLSAVYDSEMVFMHDGAPCQRSASILAFLDSRNVCLLSDWPAQSPDLNIIENMWAQIKMNTLKQYATSKDDLWTIVKHEWYAIPNDYVRSLNESLPRRLHEVIINRGL